MYFQGVRVNFAENQKKFAGIYPHYPPLFACMVVDNVDDNDVGDNHDGGDEEDDGDDEQIERSVSHLLFSRV